MAINRKIRPAIAFFAVFLLCSLFSTAQKKVPVKQDAVAKTTTISTAKKAVERPGSDPDTTGIVKDKKTPPKVIGRTKKPVVKENAKKKTP